MTRPGEEMRFRDREHAGRLLAERLVARRFAHPLVLALPRGGLPVAAPIAEALGASLDVIVARKLGAPEQPELGIGAIAEDGVLVLAEDALAVLRLGPDDLAPIIARGEVELLQAVARFRGSRGPAAVAGRTAIVVDDGLATGVTAVAALRALRRRGPKRLVLAVPVGPPESVERLADEADEVVCLLQPPRFRAVGVWYEDFSPVSDRAARALAGGRDQSPGSGSTALRSTISRWV